MNQLKDYETKLQSIISKNPRYWKTIILEVPTKTNTAPKSNTHEQLTANKSRQTLGQYLA